MAGIIVLTGCAKQDIACWKEKEAKRVYVRIVQVDKDGCKRFSRTIVAENK